MLQKRQGGFTLIEIMAGLLIVGLTLVSLLKLVANEMAFISNNATLDMNKNSVLSAVNSFYVANCRSGLFPTPTIANLVASGFLNSVEQANNPFGNDITPFINWGYPTELGARAEIIDDVSFTKLLLSTKANQIDGADLVWRDVPNIFKSRTGQQVIQFLQLHEVDSCH